MKVVARESSEGRGDGVDVLGGASGVEIQWEQQVGEDRLGGSPLDWAVRGRSVPGSADSNTLMRPNLDPAR